MSTERERLAAAAAEAMRLLRARWTDQAELDAVVTVQSELGFLRAELSRLETCPVNEVDEPQLAAALQVVVDTAPAHDVPAWVAIELYNALDVARRELARRDTTIAAVREREANDAVLITALARTLASLDAQVSAVRELCERWESDPPPAGADAVAITVAVVTRGDAQELRAVLSAPVEAGAPAEPALKASRSVISECDTCGHTSGYHPHGGPCLHRAAGRPESDGLCACVRFVDQIDDAGAPAESTSDTAREDQP